MDWQVALDEEHKPATACMEIAFPDQAPVQFGSLHIERHRPENKDVIKQDVNSTVMEPVEKELSLTVEVALHKPLRASFLEAYSGIQSVVYDVIEQI